jgi:hypothetical protein
MGVLAAMVAAASSATALEEQRGAMPAGASPDAKAQVQEQSGPAKSDAGTEIRIPGLGKLGTLPKMDFGLELLYGAEDPKPPESTEPQDDRQQDLMIHGSVKHRF